MLLMQITGDSKTLNSHGRHEVTERSTVNRAEFNTEYLSYCGFPEKEQKRIEIIFNMVDTCRDVGYIKTQAERDQKIGVTINMNNSFGAAVRQKIIIMPHL